MGNAPARRRYRINEPFEPVITVETDVTNYSDLVYILVANRPLKYEKGSSRIAYIGRTNKGVSRIAESAAKKIEETLDCPGVRRLRAFVVWSEPRPYERAELPYLLERGLLLQFREEYGKIPRFNNQGNSMAWQDELTFFRKDALKRVIARYS